MKQIGAQRRDGFRPRPWAGDAGNGPPSPWRRFLENRRPGAEGVAT